MSKRILTYNGIDLSTFKAHVSGEGAWVKPAPEYERISVPGRSGDVLLYNGRYSNVDIKYRFGITENFDTNYTNLIDALLSNPGYHKLVDSKHSGVYRMAMSERTIEPTMLPQLSAGEFDVVFNCKPQIFLDSGDEEYDISNLSYLYNPTGFMTKPLVKITTGINSFRITFRVYTQTKAGFGEWRHTYLDFSLGSVSKTFPLYYDAETGNVYDSSSTPINLNPYVTLETYEHGGYNIYEDLQIPGNKIRGALTASVDSSSVTVKIIPRWWRL